MKKIILLMCLTLGIKAQQSVNLQIVRVTQSVYAGDSIRINYKAQWPSSSSNQYTNYIYMGSNALVIKPWQYLKARPREYFAPLVQFDSAYWVMAKIPLGTNPGVYTISATGAQTQTVQILTATCTADFSYNISGLSVSFNGSFSGINPVYNWDFGVNQGYQIYPSSTSYTYFMAGTYSVTLLVTSPTCSLVVTKQITVSQPTVDTTGINEFSQDGIKPIYFDLNGKPRQKEANFILIEQIENVRRKVVITE